MHKEVPINIQKNKGILLFYYHLLVLPLHSIWNKNFKDYLAKTIYGPACLSKNIRTQLK